MHSDIPGYHRPATGFKDRMHRTVLIYTRPEALGVIKEATMAIGATLL